MASIFSKLMWKFNTAPNQNPNKNVGPLQNDYSSRRINSGGFFLILILIKGNTREKSQGGMSSSSRF